MSSTWQHSELRLLLVQNKADIAFRNLHHFPYNPNCIRAVGVNGPASIIDGIALKCDLYERIHFGPNVIIVAYRIILPLYYYYYSSTLLSNSLKFILNVTTRLPLVWYIYIWKAVSLTGSQRERETLKTIRTTNKITSILFQSCCHIDFVHLERKRKKR